MLAVALLTVVLGTFSPRTPACTLPAGKGQAVQKLTILFFTASWCEPCHSVQPILERFASKHPQEVRLVPVDFDRSPDETARWDVRKIPVVILLSKEGKILLRADGVERETLRTLPSALEDAMKQTHAGSRAYENQHVENRLFCRGSGALLECFANRACTAAGAQGGRPGLDP
jgi:thioredoxin 1